MRAYFKQLRRSAHTYMKKTQRDEILFEYIYICCLRINEEDENGANLKRERVTKTKIK